MDREDQKASLLSQLIHITVEDRLKVDNIQRNKDKQHAIERAELYEEVRKQLWLAGPLISVSMLNYSQQIISVMFVGHLGQLPLSGASMATSFASVTGFSLLVSCDLLSLPLFFRVYFLSLMFSNSLLWLYKLYDWILLLVDVFVVFYHFSVKVA